MKTLTMIALESLVMLGLGLAVENSSSALAQEAQENKAMRLFLGTVKVSEQNDGKSWDVNDGKPDIVVHIENLSDKTIKEFASAEKTDTFEAAFNVGTFLVAPGHKLKIRVVDKDVAVDDLIGEYANFEVTAEMMKKGSHKLEFGKVKSLTLEFRAP